MRFVVNFLALVIELALIGAVGYLGALYPLHFALVTAGVTLIAALGLEHARLVHEMPFYFGRPLSSAAMAGLRVWSSSESIVKAIIAGFVALLTFSGTNDERLFWTAILFAACVFVGTTVLLRVFLTWRERAVRWGYFRLAIPLGFLYSAGVYVLTQAGKLPSAHFGDVAFDATFNLARSPTIESASEFLYKLSQATDGLIGALLSTVLPPDVVPYVQILASTNVLPGYILAVYTVAIVRVAFAVQSLGGRDEDETQDDALASGTR